MPLGLELHLSVGKLWCVISRSKFSRNGEINKDQIGIANIIHFLPSLSDATPAPLGLVSHRHSL